MLQRRVFAIALCASTTGLTACSTLHSQLTTTQNAFAVNANGATQAQLQSCQKQVAAVKQVSENQIQVAAGASPVPGGVIIDWKSTDGASGYCRVNETNVVTEVATEVPGRSPSPTPSPTATPTPSPTPSPTISQAQLQSCQTYVASRYTTVPIAGIQVTPDILDAQGNAIVNWRTNTGASGFCRINADGVVTQFVTENPGVSPAPRPSPTPTPAPSPAPSPAPTPTPTTPAPSPTPTPAPPGQSGATREQLITCQNQVSVRLRTPAQNVRVFPGATDGQGNAIVNWLTVNNASGYCRITTGSILVQFVVENRGDTAQSPIEALW